MKKLVLFVSVTMLAGLLAGVDHCGRGGLVATVDRETYVVGDVGTTTLLNQRSRVVYLPGCSAFSYMKLDQGHWIDMGPGQVCPWEGKVRPLQSGAEFSEALVAPDQGIWRLRYIVGLDCAPGKPMSQAGCRRILDVYTPSFEVLQDDLQNACTESGGWVATASCCESVSDFPNLCLVGACGCAADYSHNVRICQCPEGLCFDGTACVAPPEFDHCAPFECGPSMGMPNTLCADGVTVAGPTGRCLRRDDGSCGWEVVECPEEL